MTSSHSSIATHVASRSPPAEPQEALVQGVSSQGSPGLVRRALLKFLGSAESLVRGHGSAVRSDTTHLEATPFEAAQGADGMRRLSLALQGGGVFGAFTWGVLDR